MDAVEQKVYRPGTPPEASPPLPPPVESDHEVEDGHMETVAEGSNEDESDVELDLQTQVNRLTEINENNTTYIKWLCKQIEVLKAKNEILTKINVMLSDQLAAKDTHAANPDD